MERIRAFVIEFDPTIPLFYPDDKMWDWFEDTYSNYLYGKNLNEKNGNSYIPGLVINAENVYTLYLYTKDFLDQKNNRFLALANL